jgi:hypothetical protein
MGVFWHGEIQCSLAVLGWFLLEPAVQLPALLYGSAMNTEIIITSIAFNAMSELFPQLFILISIMNLFVPYLGLTLLV